MKLSAADIRFNEHGTPIARQFDDVYFSNDNGIAETQHVFVDGNHLHQRFIECDNPAFVIAETGFGTGLNLMVLLHNFKQFKQQHPDHPLQRLHYISTEKFPLDAQSLEQALIKHKGMDEYRDVLLRQYPPPVAGTHRLHFDIATVDLYFDDATTAYQALAQTHPNCVDAWFLDGFAPSKNPDMWSQALFDAMAQCSAPHASLATFTAAGFVRRGLTDAGFNMQKTKGFGSKREMLTGVFTQTTPPATPYIYGNPANQADNIAIVGGGIAAANTALALARRGCRISLFCDTELAQGASGNKQGGFYPQLHAQASYASQLQVYSFLFAHRLYQELLAAGFEYESDLCGVLLLAHNEAAVTRQLKMHNNNIWPKELVYSVDSGQASQIAGVNLHLGGSFVPQGGWISPPSLVCALLDYAKSISEVKVYCHHPVSAVCEQDAMACIKTDTELHTFDHAVLATGAAPVVCEGMAHFPFKRVRGQVEAIPRQTGAQDLKTVLCHKGYMTPLTGERQALGSTYTRQDINTDYRIDEAEMNLNTHKQAMSGHDWVDALSHDNTGRASVRMALPDHQPVAGLLRNADSKNTLSILCGLGSRGLTTAPLMAECIASELSGSVMPLPDYLLKTISPRRF